MKLLCFAYPLHQRKDGRVVDSYGKQYQKTENGNIVRLTPRTGFPHCSRHSQARRARNHGLVVTAATAAI